MNRSQLGTFVVGLLVTLVIILVQGRRAALALERKPNPSLPAE